MNFEKKDKLELVGAVFELIGAIGAIIGVVAGCMPSSKKEADEDEE